ncbi:hypothetical protein IAU60_000827 [Kwoniella sp. DSM 27419]
MASSFLTCLILPTHLARALDERGVPPYAGVEEEDKTPLLRNPPGAGDSPAQDEEARGATYTQNQFPSFLAGRVDHGMPLDSASLLTEGVNVTDSYRLLLREAADTVLSMSKALEAERTWESISLARSGPNRSLGLPCSWNRKDMVKVMYNNVFKRAQQDAEGHRLNLSHVSWKCARLSQAHPVRAGWRIGCKATPLGSPERGRPKGFEEKAPKS